MNVPITPPGPQVHWGREAEGRTDDAVAARPVQTARQAEGGKNKRNKKGWFTNSWSEVSGGGGGILSFY